jgi:hypothetical protein
MPLKVVPTSSARSSLRSGPVYGSLDILAVKGVVSAFGVETKEQRSTGTHCASCGLLKGPGTQHAPFTVKDQLTNLEGSQ